MDQLALPFLGLSVLGMLVWAIVAERKGAQLEARREKEEAAATSPKAARRR
ncbi:hypothetical protein [Phenylobacterium sp. Root700]|uniref:hypothetical protein n=1 Tax=Phenylobacterium sp. Root700 TaxID=1736591 RepID=UPI0012E39E3F|nr:hypothetical protein [Phenylobacterium sp. Root700]